MCGGYLRRIPVLTMQVFGGRLVLLFYTGKLLHVISEEIRHLKVSDVKSVLWW